jgi:hypothetical protein
LCSIRHERTIPDINTLRNDLKVFSEQISLACKESITTHR